MDLAALIIGTLALIVGVICLSLMLAKNFFSTHQVQMVPVNPMQELMGNLNPEMGKGLMNEYRELGDPIDKDELEALEELKRRRQAKTKI